MPKSFDGVIGLIEKFELETGLPGEGDILNELSLKLEQKINLQDITDSWAIERKTNFNLYDFQAEKQVTLSHEYTDSQTYTFPDYLNKGEEIMIKEEREFLLVPTREQNQTLITLPDKDSFLTTDVFVFELPNSANLTIHFQSTMQMSYQVSVFVQPQEFSLLQSFVKENKLITSHFDVQYTTDCSLLESG